MAVVLQIGRQQGQVEVAAESEEPVHQAQRPDALRSHHHAPGDRAVTRGRLQCARPSTISLRSASLIDGISSGRLRNQGQNKRAPEDAQQAQEHDRQLPIAQAREQPDEEQRRDRAAQSGSTSRSRPGPSPARSTASSRPSCARSTEMSRPGTRRRGIEPPRESRRSRRTRGGRNATRTSSGGQARAAQHDRGDRVAHAESVAQESPGHLEEPVADHERGHDVCRDRRRTSPSGVLNSAQAVAKPTRCRYVIDRQAARRRQNLVTHPRSAGAGSAVGRLDVRSRWIASRRVLLSGKERSGVRRVA